MNTLAKTLARKPGVILAPQWKSIVKETRLTEKQVLLGLADTLQVPIATAFVSQNIYTCPPGDKLIARLTANVMFHGEIGLDTLYGLKTISDVQEHLPVIDLFGRKLKIVLPDESTEKVGKATGRLFKHANKLSALLDSDCESLADHAWLACAFSFANSAGRVVASGAAARKTDGQVFRAGEIETVISAQDAVIVGMRANNCEPDVDDNWEFCNEQNFHDHRWFPRFEQLRSK